MQPLRAIEIISMESRVQETVSLIGKIFFHATTSEKWTGKAGKHEPRLLERVTSEF